MASVRIRMFRQGLGDSFLLTFPGDPGEVHVLIDFGVLLGTPNAKAKMQAMAKHIVQATAGNLHYLVATHEHWDHVSGFAQAQEELAKDKLAVELKGAKGVRVYVLGPPHSKKWIKKSDPTKSASEVYELHAADGSDFGLFSALDALDAGGLPESQPFDEWFRMSEAEAKGHPFFSDHYAGGPEWRRIESDWLGPAGPLALQLDSDTNNTSLVLAFELIESGRVLLFPADAQVGNWMSWNDVEWSVEKGGKTEKIMAEQLLAKTVFYKIGHHGSHNATLRTLGLERMGGAGGLVAMLPLDRPTAKTMEWNMPFPSLYDALLERCKGRILDLKLGMSAKPAAIAQAEWDRFAGDVDVQADWVDYSVPMS